jgi:hypothetical protein
VTMRLRRAEERLAGAFAAAHARSVNRPECRTTRAAMHDYVKGRLLPGRQRRLEVHMNGCGECTRAFVDMREVPWMLRDLGQPFGGAMITGAVGGAAAVASTATPRSFSKKETAVAAGVLAALAIGGGAATYVANQPGQPPIQAIEDAGTTSDGAGSPRDEDQPASISPADPQPRPATPPKEGPAPAPSPVEAPAREVAARPAVEPGPSDVEQSPENAPAPNPLPDEPAPAAPPAPPATDPVPEPPPEPTPPEEEPSDGPPGNPDNDNSRGPGDKNGQGPGGQGPDNGRGPDPVIT